MITEIKNTNIEVLKGRIKNGIEYCNSLFQQSKEAADNPEQYHKIMVLLDSSIQRLDNLIYAANALDYKDCVFGECKFDADEFFCFRCTELDSNGKI